MTEKNLYNHFSTANEHNPRSTAPALLQTDAQNIPEMKKKLDKLLEISNPSDHNLAEEAYLSAYIIDHHVSQINQLIKTKKPDFTLLNESHSIANHQWIQSRLALQRGENLGLELQKNMHMSQFLEWNKNQNISDFTREQSQQIQNYLENQLNTHELLRGTNYTVLTLETKKMRSFLLDQYGLSISLNDAAYHKCTLDNNDPITKKAIIDTLPQGIFESIGHKINMGEEEGLEARNRVMMHLIKQNATSLQQCGADHVTGNLTDSPVNGSLIYLCDKTGIKVIAPLALEHETDKNNLPNMMREHPAISGSFTLRGREFYNFDTTKEREMNAALMETWNFPSHLQAAYIKTLENDTNKVNRTFENTALKLEQNNLIEQKNKIILEV